MSADGFYDLSVDLADGNNFVRVALAALFCTVKEGALCAFKEGAFD